MTENIRRSPISEAYKSALNTSHTHSINGEQYVAGPIDIKDFSKKIDDKFKEYKKNNTPITCYNFKKVSLKSFEFARENAKFYCGKDITDNLEEDEKMSPEKSAVELTNLMYSLLYNKANDVILSPEMKALFTNLQEKPINVYTFIGAVYNGTQAARLCGACEQVGEKGSGSVVGDMIHISSKIIEKALETPTGNLPELWNQEDMYKNTINEFASPNMVGFVDVLIKAVEFDKEKYPNLDKFFASMVKSGDFEGSYYDMVTGLPGYDLKSEDQK